MTLEDIEFTIDEDSLKQFEKICAEAGTTVNDACVMFARYCVKYRRFPFEISLLPELFENDPEVQEVISSILNNIKLALLNGGKETYTVEEIVDLLDKIAMVEKRET